MNVKELMFPRTRSVFRQLCEFRRQFSATAENAVNSLGELPPHLVSKFSFMLMHLKTVFFDEVPEALGVIQPDPSNKKFVSLIED